MVVIFGAGEKGRLAALEVGIENVAAFSDNDQKKTDSYFQGKKVISFSQMIDMFERGYEIVIAGRHLTEMALQLHENGIDNFYVMVKKYGLKKVKFQNKGIIEFLQYRIVDHCNLNCKNCGSVCNAKVVPWQVDLEEFEKDIMRLKQLFSFIGTIKLMGGEPLLHTQLDKIVEIVRMYFADSEIEIATNGLAIPKLSDDMLNAFRRNNVVFHISEYEPTSAIMDKIDYVCRKFVIRWYAVKCKGFFKVITDKLSNPFEAWQCCGIARDCMNIKRGKLYRCAGAEAFEKLNTQFGTKYELCEKEDYINIYDENIDIYEQIKIFSGAGPMCRYCTDKPKEVFEWEMADGVSELSDYIIQYDKV